MPGEHDPDPHNLVNPYRGEIVDPVQSSLPESVPLLLVKPPIGLSTPEIFKALDLSRASQADPQQLLQAMLKQGLSQELCVNDLEQPAFDRWGRDHSASMLYCQAFRIVKDYLR